MCTKRPRNTGRECRDFVIGSTRDAGWRESSPRTATTRRSCRDAMLPTASDSGCPAREWERSSQAIVGMTSSGFVLFGGTAAPSRPGA